MREIPWRSGRDGSWMQPFGGCLRGCLNVLHPRRCMRVIVWDDVRLCGGAEGKLVWRVRLRRGVDGLYFLLSGAWLLFSLCFAVLCWGFCSGVSL